MKPAFNRDALLASADKLLAKGKQEAALKEFLKILDDNPDDVLVLNKVGDLYVLLNRTAESITYFSRIADYYAKDGFFLKAIAIYKKINKLDPARLEVYGLLADLYHKQGLVPEARAQYQILADHFTKQSKISEAIHVYRKMAAADPNDIKIPVRLADMLTAAGRTDEALMEYGVIGSMLIRRGAFDEAVAVYQKALKIRPGDPKTLKDLVRSLTDQGNAEAAALLLKTQPRNAETMSMLAEALLATNNRDEARKAAEGAIAFDEHHEGARRLLSLILLSEREPGPAFSALLPVLEKAGRSGEIRKAIEMLAPFTSAASLFRPALEKMLELQSLAGDREGQIAALRLLAREAETRRDSAAAGDSYRRWLELDPENSEARTKAGAFAPAGPPVAAPPAPRASAPVAPPAEDEFVVDFDESSLAETPPTPRRMTSSPLSIDWEEPAAPPAAPAPSGKTLADDAEWKNGITEAEVFAKYGLIEKAVEKYRSLSRKRPEDLVIRQRFVELLSESKSPTFPHEALQLVNLLTSAERPAEAEAARARFLGSPGVASAPAAPAIVPPPAPSQPPAARAAFETNFAPEDFPAAPPSPPAPSPSFDFDDFGTLSIAPAQAPPAAPSPAPPSPPSVPPVDLEMTFDSGLGRAIEDEMARFQPETIEEAADVTPAANSVDEMSLFSDEQNFFNLAAELEKELSEEDLPESPILEAEPQEASLEEIFREFKKGVEQQLSAEDYETHYNLGIAYKEMGLLDEAIGEFQIASKDPARSIECCSMLGLCFLEKGLPQLAIEWYSKGLENPSIKPEERMGLRYDLALIHEQAGDSEKAYNVFLQIYGENTNYRDVVSRVKNLEASLRR